MKRYGLDPTATQALLRRLTIRTTVVMAVAVAIGIGVVVIAGARSGQSARDLLVPVVGALVIGVVTLAASITARFRREHRALQSFAVEIDDDGLTRYQDGLVPLRIGRSEIVRVTERAAGLCVETGRPDRLLGIPAVLQGYADVREQLGRWSPITAASDGFARLRGVALGLLLVASWSAVGLAPWPWVILPAASLWAIGGWLLRWLRTDPNVRRDQKRIFVIGIGLIMFAPIGRLLLALVDSLLQ